MQNVKGTMDFFGREQAVRSWIQEKLAGLFELYDFDRMETTMLNEMELLSSKYGGGEEILKEVYQLSDRGDRRLGLRYDLTVPFTKVLALNPGLSLPVKRYEIGRVFRDGPVKKGRLREFIQCDADICGVAGPEAEAELLQLAAEGFRRLAVPVEIRWNNRKFLGELLEVLGVPAAKGQTVMLTLDKTAKLEAGEVKAELLSKGLELETTAAVMELIALKEPDFAGLCNRFGLENGPGAAEIEALQRLIDATGLAEVCRFDPFLSRGLSIYTGTVYEIFDASGTFTSSLGAGGRYDTIVGKLTGDEERDYPTVGLSFGIESIAELLKDRELAVARPAAAVIPIGQDTMPLAIQAAALLRASGIRTSMELSGRKLKKALAAADARSIRFAVLIGSEEAAQGLVRLKDMADRTETAIPLDQAIMIIGKTAGGANWR